MPLMISRIGQERGRPVPFAAGRWGSITRHSSSVTSVWYRLALRLCFLRVVGVHMVSPGLVSATPPWNHAHPSHSTAFETAAKKHANNDFEIIGGVARKRFRELTEEAIGVNLPKISSEE